MGCTQSRFDVSDYLYAVPINAENPGESQIYRNPRNKAELSFTLDGEPEVLTVHDGFMHAFNKYPDNQHLGTRQHNPDGTLGPYQFKTYAQVKDLATKIGSGIINLQLVPPHGTNDADFLIIWSKNREEWVVTDIACVLYNMCLVPVYDTLGPDTINFIFSQTKATTLFLPTEHLDAAIANAKNCPTLKNLVIFESITSDQRNKAEAAGLKIYTLEQVAKSGEFRQQYRKPKPTDLYTVNYTSGTTGLPKGVMITHRNQLAASSAVSNRDDFNLVSKDCYLSYLPLAHTLERTAMLTFSLKGVAIGFYGGDVQKIKDDLQELKPTFFVSVPRLFSRFYDKMQEGLAQTTGAKKAIAEKAVKTKLENLKENGKLTHSLYDSLVFSKMKQALGGRVRIMLTGSAPIEPEVQNFLRIAAGVPFVEGYGQTESSAASFISRTEIPSMGHVGGPLGCIEYKVVDVEEMNYTSRDRNEAGIPTPRGEICLRGPSCFGGYYKDPERTAETIDKDGWVHTGDIGRINPDGSLSIIDRKKNIFKLAQGEYVASEKVENTYITSKYIAEAFLYGDSLKTYTVAIAVANKDALLELGREMGLGHLSYEQLCANRDVCTRVLADMNKKGREHKINSFELAKHLHLEPTSFVEKGLLTPTFKLVRHQAKNYYQAVIAELYSLPVDQKK